MLLLRDESVKVAKAMLIIKPLAELSLSTPTAERLGHTVSRRALDDDVEVGAFGLPIVSHMMAKIRETSPASLMAMQLRSALDAAAGLQRMRSRLPEGDDDAQADFWLQLSGMVDVVIKLVHRQSQIASGHAQHKLVGVGGKAPKGLVEAIITMLSDGTVKALTSAPDRCTVFGLLAIYISLLDAKATASVRAMFEKHAWGGSSSASSAAAAGGDDDAATASSTTNFSPRQRKMFKASLSCYRTRVKRGMSCDPDAEFEGVTFADLQAWIPSACFYDLLCEKVNPGSKSIEQHVKRALRACLGLQTEMAMAAGDSATPGKKRQPSSSTKKSAGGKKKASKRHRSKDDDEDEDEEDENEEGRDEDENDGQDAPAANEDEEEEANDDDNEEEEEEDADDDEDVGFAKKRGKPKSKRGGGQTKKKTNAAATSAAAAAKKKKQSASAGGRKPSLSSSSSSASSSASTSNPSSSQSTFLSALITGGSSMSAGGRQASSSSSSNAKGSGAGGGAAAPHRRSVTRPHPGTAAATATMGVGANTGEYNRFTQDTGISLTQRPNIDDDDE